MTPTGDEPPARTQPAPRPLPPAWERAIANDIAATLRRGWITSTEKAAITNTGNPRGHTYQTGGTIPSPTPTSEILSRTAYARGLLEPNPTLNTPWLVWHLEQLALAQALAKHGLLQHHETVNAFLHARTHGRPTNPFQLRTNRHGTLKLRRNAPEAVTSTLLTAARVARIEIVPTDYAEEHLYQNETILLTELERILSSPENTHLHARTARGYDESQM